MPKIEREHVLTYLDACSAAACAVAQEQYATMPALPEGQTWEHRHGAVQWHKAILNAATDIQCDIGKAAAIVETFGPPTLEITTDEVSPDAS